MVDTRGSASAYIDNYFRWGVSSSAEENLKNIRVVECAQRTGSHFATEKTELIHLVRPKKDIRK